MPRRWGGCDCNGVRRRWVGGRRARTGPALVELAQGSGGGAADHPGAPVGDRSAQAEHALVQGLARQLGTAWRTVWSSIRSLLEAAAADESCFEDVTTLDVDEHVWHDVSVKPEGQGGRGPKELTGMVDLSRDRHGRVRARLLNLVPGRSCAAYSQWLKARNEAFHNSVEVAMLDPFHGYKNAIDDQLDDAVACWTRFTWLSSVLKPLMRSGDGYSRRSTATRTQGRPAVWDQDAPAVRL